MNDLKEMEARAIYIIREAYFRYKRIGLLWSVGKDSTAMLWMALKAFLGKIPFPVIHIDTSYKFDEIYEYRNTMANAWRLNLMIAKNHKALAEGVGPETGTKLECCTQLKTQAFKDFMRYHELDAVLLGIRRDEHGIRSKERYFSPRDAEHRWNYKNQPPELWNQFKTGGGEDHVRVHPILHMTELDVWRYVAMEEIPLTNLYFAQDTSGKRYRSIGCKTCCRPVDSNASDAGQIIAELEVTKEAERSGRAQDKEDAYIMQKLRAMGYM
jgi:sulfate adenylyltransferase subunit 2